MSSNEKKTSDKEKKASKRRQTSRTPVDKEDVIPLTTDESNSFIGRFFTRRIKNRTPEIKIKEQLLPNEKHLSSKLVVYFDELQIIFGLLLILSPIGIFYIVPNVLSIIIPILLGLITIVTGYATEELHITNSRILVRRMNWVDRLFRIPSDSQYILDEIVSFDIQRAPINMVLFLSSGLPLILLFLDSFRQIYLLIPIIIVSLILLILSQRLGKRTISFNMSGGHQVDLGVYKGIPLDVVDAFIDIIMEKNIFETDEY